MLPSMKSLFTAIDEMREIEHHAENLTRTARRNRTRRAVNTLPTLSSPAMKINKSRQTPLQSGNTPI